MLWEYLTEKQKNRKMSEEKTDEKMEAPKKEPKLEQKKPSKAAKIAVIRIQGPVKIGKGKEDTLRMLRLHRKHACVVLEKTPSILGMIKKVQNKVTWGEIDDSTIKELTSKRGEKTKTKDGKEAMKPYFRLHPPKGGYERKGIKMPFSLGGVVGYRGDKINDLIKRML
jgi:large subunit ribosomal protein L30